jgi:hypothetical protein
VEVLRRQAKTKNMNTLLFVLTILLSPVFYIWNGFVAFKLWEWFIIPNFANAPKLSIAACIGVVLVVKYFSYGSADIMAAKYDAMRDKDEDEKAIDLAYNFFSKT